MVSFFSARKYGKNDSMMRDSQGLAPLMEAQDMCKQWKESNVLDPQSGGDTFRGVKAFWSTALYGQRQDALVKQGLMIALLISTLRGCKTRASFTSAVLMYLQSISEQSLLINVCTFFSGDYVDQDKGDDFVSVAEIIAEEIFSDDCSVQSDDSGINSVASTRSAPGNLEPTFCAPGRLEPNSGVLETLEKVYVEFSKVIHSDIVKKLFKMLNTITAAGLCSAAGITCSVAGLRIFTPVVAKRQATAVDVFDAVFLTIKSFVEGGFRVFKNGKISSFFENMDDISVFSEEVDRILEHSRYVRAGNLMEKFGIDDNTYDESLVAASSRGKELKARLPYNKVDEWQVRILHLKIEKLMEAKAAFDQTRTRGGLREAPFAICLFGKSGVGKSTLSEMTIKAVLMFAGLSAAPETIVSWDPDDKYASNVRSHIQAIKFDDVANTRPQFERESPLIRILKCINNVVYCPPMGEVDLKGKVSMRPKVVLATTNRELMDAQVYSQEPASILRRLYHVVVKVRDEFMTDGRLDPSKAMAAYGDVTSDVWLLTVRKYRVPFLSAAEASVHHFVIVEDDKGPLKDVGVTRYMEWVQDCSRAHFKLQRALVEKMRNDCEISACPTCSKYYCGCVKGPAVVPLTPEVAIPPGLRCPGVPQKRISRRPGFLDELEAKCLNPPDVKVPKGLRCPGVAQRKISKRPSFFEDLEVKCLNPNAGGDTPWMDMCAWNSWILSWNFLPRCLWLEKVLFAMNVCQSIPQIVCVVCVCLFLTTILFIVLADEIGLKCSFVLCLLFLYITIECFAQAYCDFIDQKVLSQADVCRKVAVRAAGALAVSSCLLLTYLKLFKLYRKHMNPQTGLIPGSDEDVAERDSRANPWADVHISPLPQTLASRTTSPSDLVTKCQRNLIGIVSKTGKTTCGFFPTSNILIVPKHFIDKHEGDFTITGYRHAFGTVGNTFHDIIAQSNVYHVPETDMCAVYLTAAGSMADLRKFLPQSRDIGKCPAQLVVRRPTGGTYSVCKILYRGSTTVTHTLDSFPGGHYQLPIDTFEGMCMGPVISDMKGAMFLGFHLAGSGKTGGCGTLTQPEFALAEAFFSSVPGNILLPASGTLPLETYGVKTLRSPTVHRKSALNFLPEDSNVEVFGQTGIGATPHSTVIDLEMSPIVEEVMGQENCWGPPKLRGHNIFPYQAHLAKATDLASPFGSELQEAVEDYLEIVPEVKAATPKLFKVGPLSNLHNVNGEAGCRFIDAIKISTACGFPLKGKKEDFLTTYFDEIGNELRDFQPEIWDEVSRLEDVYAQGDRAYPIYKSCLKDEVTSVTKEKVRVFQACPIAFTLLTRKYFLRIARIMQSNPLKFECAVGINAVGPEWDQMWTYLFKDGEDTIFGGDYADYDTRMPAQNTIASYYILIEIAKQCDGYTDRDIGIMQAMVADLVYPVMTHNGDLIMLFGTNPSGNSMTVVINGLGGSINTRCFFYRLKKKIKIDGKFRKYVRLITYGDDNAGSVSKKLPEFNHVTFAAYLALHGMKFTMPDKKAKPIPYIPMKDFDFLKRKNRYSEELDINVSYLVEKSIFKRLHARLDSKVMNDTMASAQNICTSADDWFFHGREVFEARQAQLIEVAEKRGISYLVPELKATFDERVEKWNMTYRPPDPMSTMESIDPQE